MTCGREVESNGLGEGPVVGCCEHGKDSLIFIMGGDSQGTMSFL
jgi:hypothetical protein